MHFPTSVSSPPLSSNLWTEDRALQSVQEPSSEVYSFFPNHRESLFFFLCLQSLIFHSSVTCTSEQDPSTMKVSFFFLSPTHIHINEYLKFISPTTNSWFLCPSSEKSICFWPHSWRQMKLTSYPVQVPSLIYPLSQAAPIQIEGT